MRGLPAKRPMNAPATAGSAAIGRMRPHEPFRSPARPRKVKQGTTAMKAASTLLQIIALSACFTVYVSGGGAISSGVRRAIQTMTANQVTIPVEAPAAEGVAFEA